jgi:ribosomal protein S18 acetylase RimI-like enzyme
VDVTIRLAEVADAERLAPLHLRVWQEAYTGLVPEHILDRRAAEPLEARVDRWRGRIAAPSETTWVALDGDEAVGFAESGPDRDGSGELELSALYVRADRYGTGLGHRLLVTAIGDRPARLWVLDGNERAIAFYRRHGFVLDGRSRSEPEGLHVGMTRD